MPRRMRRRIARYLLAASTTDASMEDLQHHQDAHCVVPERTGTATFDRQHPENANAVALLLEFHPDDGPVFVLGVALFAENARATGHRLIELADELDQDGV